MPQRVVDAVTDYLVSHNSNIHGFFATTIESDHLLADARDALADFLGCDWDEVAFGANTTTLNFLLAHSLAHDLNEGDEIVITELDHEANRGPWLSLQDRGVVVREVPVDPATCTLDWDAFARHAERAHARSSPRSGRATRSAPSTTSRASSRSPARPAP